MAAADAHPTPKGLPRGVPLLLTTTALTTIGILAQTTALGIFVYDLTGRELDLGLIGLAEFLPTALFAPLVGPLADRFDRRRVAAFGLTGEALCAIALALYIRSEPTSVWPIFLIVIGFGLARAVVAPAIRALPADLAGLRLARVVPLSSATWQAGVIVGPVIGGFLYAGAPWWPFLVAAILIGTGVVLVSLVPHVARPPVVAAPGVMGPIREAVEGLRFVRRNPILLGTMSLDLFAVLFGGVVALLPAYAEKRLGVGAVGLGWLRAAGGIGGAVMTLTLAVRPVRRHVGRVLLLAVGAFGVGTLVLGLTRSFVVAFLALAFLQAADSISVFIRATLVPLVTPPSMRGRVLATENVFIGASNELGAFESGVAGQLLGVVGAILTGGVATIAIVVLWWWKFPALRDVDRFSDVVAVE